jgi:phosphatidylserine/phosphatidylglycerophosphate/cardiolipin synthase-like enzyme
MHAKIYVGEFAATVGSSNFTDAGLASQFEANARFERSQEMDRYAETSMIAENYWKVGEPWVEELRCLLKDLLAFVSWQEALARACADLLEGQWASRYLSSESAAST